MGKRIQQVPLKSLGTEILYLGYVGENIHTQIVINCSEVFVDYPDAEASMVVKPPVGDLYHSLIERDGRKIVWEITNSDVAYSGSGQIQLTFTYQGEVIRSIIGRTSIDPSIEATGEAPTPLQNWMDAADEKASEMAQEAATQAAGAIENLTVSATSGNPGATIRNVDGHKHIDFTMPIPSVSGTKLIFS